MGGGLSELDLDRALGRVDAGAQHLSGLAVHAAGAQIAHLAGAQAPDTAVADAHPAAEGQLDARLLAGDEDRLLSVAARAELTKALANVYQLNNVENQCAWMLITHNQGIVLI